MMGVQVRGGDTQGKGHVKTEGYAVVSICKGIDLMQYTEVYKITLQHLPTESNGEECQRSVHVLES